MSYKDKVDTLYTLLWYYASKKKSRFKMQKSDKNNFNILKKNTSVSSDHHKTCVKLDRSDFRLNDGTILNLT